MTQDTKEPWILAGYELFAKEGPKGLKVEVTARMVNKSKSSFYHHFSDNEVFTEILLNYHLQRAKIIAVRESTCKHINPDLIYLLLNVKQDLLFNRQLRINRTVPAFKDCFEKSNKLMEPALLEVWAKDINLPDKGKVANLILGLVLENFYLQITDKTLTYEWLANYFHGIRLVVAELKKS